MKNNKQTTNMLFKHCELPPTVNNHEQLENLLTSYTQVKDKLFQEDTTVFHNLTLPTTSITIL